MEHSYIDNLNMRLIKANLYNCTSTLMFFLEKMLSTFDCINVKKYQESIELNIIAFYEDELQNQIEYVKELYGYDGDYDEYGVWHSEYSKYFYPDFSVNELAIRQDFDIPERWANDDYDSLAWILEIGYFHNENEMPALNYQIMAIQATIYLEDFIKNPDEIIHLSNVFLAFREAEKMANEMDKQGELLELEHRIKREVIEKAIQVRHKDNKRVKSLVIQRWQNYKQQKLKQGKKPSKTAFSKRIFDELKKAHQENPNNNKSYSFKTIRNNWLQGVN